MSGAAVKWLLLALVASIGAVAMAAASADGTKMTLSYLGGLVLVVASFEFGVFNIRLADRYVPNLTMTVALLSYLTTAVAFGLVLAASSPRVVSGVGVAAGLSAGLLVWVGALLVTSLVASRVRD